MSTQWHKQRRTSLDTKRIILQMIFRYFIFQITIEETQLSSGYKRTIEEILVSCSFFKLVNYNQYFRSPCYRLQRSCEGYVFTGVCLSTGGEYLGRYPPRPGAPQGQIPPGTRYTPQDQVHPRDQVHPPGRRLTLRTVRILLECILLVI